MQAETCAPIVRALGQGAEPWPNPRNCQDGLRVSKAIGDFVILRVIRDRGGTAVAVSDHEVLQDMKGIGALEGVSAVPPVTA